MADGGGMPKKRRAKASGGGKKNSVWTVLNAGFVVALVGLAGALGAVIIPHFLDGPSSTSGGSGGSPGGQELRVDSVTVESWAQAHPNVETDGLPGYDTLDFKVQNVGGQLAVISAVRIQIEKIKPIYQSGILAYLPPSAQYYFTLPFKDGPCSAPVSEEVAAGQADRFDLNLELSGATAPNQPYQYNVELSLVYGQGALLSAGDETLLLSRSEK
jgi:hypothetical protein